jgi:hypothetical protein
MGGSRHDVILLLGRFPIRVGHQTGHQGCMLLILQVAG